MDMKSYENNDLKSHLAYNQPLFCALGDTTRQEIIFLLAESDANLSVGELALQTKLSRPAVSHHLRILKEAGLLEEEKRGVRRYYRPTFVQAVRDMAKLLQAVD